jgi:hypothetical protein
MKRTAEELREMNNIRRRRSYEKNREKEKEKALKRYYDSKPQLSTVNSNITSSSLSSNNGLSDGNREFKLS